MDSSSSISRIYDLKTIGVQQVIGDLDAVYARIEKISAAKKNLTELKGSVYDPNILSQVTSQIDKLNDLQTETISQLKELNTTTKQGVTAQTEFAASVAKTAAEQKGAAVVMDEAATAMGANLSATTAGVTKMQATLSSATRSGIDYDATLQTLGSRLQQLRGDTESINAEFKLLDAQLKEGKISGEAYTESQIALTIELQQNKTQITEVTAAMTALNKVYNPALIEEENAQLAINREELLQRTNLLKLQAKEELAVAGSIDEARAQAALYRKELNALDLTTQEGIARQEQLIKTIAEHDLFIKNNADLYTRQKINIGNYPNPQAELSAIRQEMGRLAVAGEAGGAEFAKLSGRAKVLTASLAEVKTATTEATTATDKLTSMFERMGLRMLLNIFVFQAALEEAQLLYKSISENTHGTDAYIAKQKELTDAMNSQNEVLTKQVEKYAELQKAKNVFFDFGETSFKREVDRLKAIGVVNGEVYDAEILQLKAEQALRDQQISDLDAVQSKYKQVQDIFAAYDKYGDLGGARKLLKALGLSPEDLKEFNLQIDEFVKARSDLSEKDQGNFKLSENDALFKKISDIHGKVNNTESEKVNAETALLAKLNNLTYSKNLELQQELRQLKTQYRAISEKEDIETVDKIVSDTNRKYSAMIADIERKKKELSKHYPGGVLPDNIAADYASIEAIINQEKLQDRANQLFEKAKKDYDNYNSTETSLGNAGAALSKHESDYGYANYGKMVAALDKETAAKKTALDNQFKNQAANIVDAGQLAELQLQKDRQIEQIDQDSYKKRLGFASEYFKRLTQNTTDASAIIIEQIDTITLNKLTDIANGGGNAVSRGRATFAANHSGAINKANEEIVNTQSILPDAKDATEKAKAAMLQADGIDQMAIATQKYNEALKAQTDIENKLAKAKNDKANEEDKVRQFQRDINKEIADTMLDTARTLSNGYMDLMSKQDAFHEAMAQRSLTWNQRVMNTEVQSRNEMLAQAKANMIAEQQISKEKMQNEKNRAISQAIINEGLAATQIIVNTLMSPTAKAMPDGGLTLALLAEGASLAAFTAQIANISQAPAYAGGLNPVKNLAWVGDGGESELMKIGNSWSISPNKPTLIDSTGLQSVTPLSQVTQYRGTMGGQLQAPAFYSNSTGGSNSAHESAIQGLYGVVGMMGQHLSNMNINYDPKGADRAGMNLNYKRRRI